MRYLVVLFIFLSLRTAAQDVSFSHFFRDDMFKFYSYLDSNDFHFAILDSLVTGEKWKVNSNLAKRMNKPIYEHTSLGFQYQHDSTGKYLAFETLADLLFFIPHCQLYKEASGYEVMQYYPKSQDLKLDRYERVGGNRYGKIFKLKRNDYAFIDKKEDDIYITHNLVRLKALIPDYALEKMRMKEKRKARKE